MSADVINSDGGCGSAVSARMLEHGRRNRQFGIGRDRGSRTPSKPQDCHGNKGKSRGLEYRVVAALHGALVLPACEESLMKHH